MTWKENPGICPEEARGKTVRVQLRNGDVAKSAWKAASTRWTLSGHPFDVVRYRVVD